MKTPDSLLLKHADGTVELCRVFRHFIKSAAAPAKSKPFWIHVSVGLAFQIEDAYL